MARPIPQLIDALNEAYAPAGNATNLQFNPPELPPSPFSAVYASWGAPIHVPGAGGVTHAGANRFMHIPRGQGHTLVYDARNNNGQGGDVRYVETVPNTAAATSFAAARRFAQLIRDGDRVTNEAELQAMFDRMRALETTMREQCPMYFGISIPPTHVVDPF